MAIDIGPSSKKRTKTVPPPSAFLPHQLHPDLSGHYLREWSECIRANGVNE